MNGIPMEDGIRVYVGCDESQHLPYLVLAHSIRAHAAGPVAIHSLAEIRLPQPADPRYRSRTPFSFARFAIPALAARRGRAIYLDADMLVFADIAELWSLPFHGSSVVVQGDPPTDGPGTFGPAGRVSRQRQISVMLLDCGALDWNVGAIVEGLGTRYSYEELMYDLCILPPGAVSFGLPHSWNSLEYWDRETRLLHYTDMPTQPWVFPGHPLGPLWLDALRRALADGGIERRQVERAIAAGHIRPSLLGELDRRDPPSPEDMARCDREAGFVAHRGPIEWERHRLNLVRALEEAGQV